MGPPQSPGTELNSDDSMLGTHACKVGLCNSYVREKARFILKFKTKHFIMYSNTQVVIARTNLPLIEFD